MSEVIFCIACLLVVIASCIAGLFSKHYRENLMQYLSLWLIMAGSSGRAWQLWIKLNDWLDRTPFTPELDVRNHNVALYAGLALFAAGTAWKVFRHRETIRNDGNFQRAELQ